MADFLEEEIKNFEILEEDEDEQKAESRNSRNRCWVGTWNNPSMTDEQFLEHFKKLYNDEILQYAIFQRELGEVSKIQHYQFFLNFKNPQYFSKLKSTYVPHGAHFKPMISTARRCQAYCSKVETRISGPYEIGDFVEERQRSDLAKAIQLIDEGVSFEVISKIFPTQSLQYSRQLKDREQMVALQQEENNFRKLDVTYIYGPAGSGKTRFVLDKYGMANVYRVKFYDQRAFDAYRGQKIIFFDEFRSQFKISDMLSYLDGYPLELPCRNKDRVARYLTVYLASNISLDKQYLDVQANEPETFKALLRRINHVIRFDRFGMQHLEKTSAYIDQLKMDDLPFDID